MKTVGLFASTLLVALGLTGCGGGGGGSTTSTASPSPAAVRAVNQKLTLTRVSWGKNDVIANTKVGAPKVASLSNQLLQLWQWPFRALGHLIPTAYAQVVQSTYPPVTYDPGFLASRKLIRGDLFSLDPIIKVYERDANGQVVLDKDGKPVEITVTCDLSTAEISIIKVFELFADGGDFLTQVDIPDLVKEDCSIQTRRAWLYVTAGGETYDVTTGLYDETTGLPGGVNDVIVAGDPAFNQSATPLVVDSNGVVKYAQLQADKSLKLVQLTTLDAPIVTNVTGSFAYNGQYLLGASTSSSSSSALFFVYEKDSTAFRLFRPGSSDSIGGYGWNTNGYLNVGLDDQGRFLFHHASDYFRALNTSDLTFSEAFSGLTNTAPGATPVVNTSWPIGMFGFQGRYGKWIMSDRGALWNYETRTSLCLMNFPNTSPSVDNCWGGTYVRLWGKYAYAVDRDKNIFVRYDLDTGTGVGFNISNSGFLAKDFKVFKDLAMVEVVQSSTSDRKYVELNFDSNQLIERGVITSGGRTVDTFTPTGG